MRESTKEMLKALGMENADQTAHLYLYIKYITHYLYHLGAPVGLVKKRPAEEITSDLEEVIEIFARKVMREALSRETSTYHGKLMPLNHAEDLVRVEEDIELRNLERVIPYEIAHDIVLVNPQKIAVFNCPCRLLQENPCGPLDVCMVVGDPLATFIVDHKMLGARWISSDEAVEILRAEHERGHVHGAYFKDVVGGRFYAICNCCTCCCIGMRAFKTFKTPMFAESGYVAGVNEECTSCGDCESACPFDAICIDDVAVVDRELCMGCGVCEGACEFEAIRLELDPSRSEPLDIKRLISEAGQE